MKKAFFVLIALCCSLLTVYGQEKFVLKGKVVDFITVIPLENVCVHNLSSGMMTFSDRQGNYALRVTKTDTLAFSRVGFDIELLIVNDSIYENRSHFFVRLLMRAVMLKNFTVYAMKPYPLFVKDLSQKAPQEKVNVPGVELSTEEKARMSKPNTSGNLLAGTPLASPITLLYEKFSRRAQLNRTYRQLVENQDEIMRLAQKYNPKIVADITHLSGSAVDEFMVYCAFSYYTLAISSEAEIEGMIRQKFIEYQKLDRAN